MHSFHGYTKAKPGAAFFERSNLLWNLSTRDVQARLKWSLNTKKKAFKVKLKDIRQSNNILCIIVQKNFPELQKVFSQQAFKDTYQRTLANLL